MRYSVPFVLSLAAIAALVTACGDGTAAGAGAGDTPRDRALTSATADQAMTCAGGLVEADTRGLRSHNARMIVPWEMEVVATSPHLQVRCAVTSDVGVGTVTATQLCADEDTLACTRLDRLVVGGRVIYAARAE